MISRKRQLFDEADQVEPEDQAIEHEVSHSASTSRSKKKKTRKPLPAELPRVMKVVELDLSERQCRGIDAAEYAGYGKRVVRTTLTISPASRVKWQLLFFENMGAVVFVIT